MSATERPEHFERLYRRVLELDTAFFAENTGEDRYARPYVPGEFWPYHYPDCAFVNVVHPVASGMIPDWDCASGFFFVRVQLTAELEPLDPNKHAEVSLKVV